MWKHFSSFQFKFKWTLETKKIMVKKEIFNNFFFITSSLNPYANGIGEALRSLNNEILVLFRSRQKLCPRSENFTTSRKIETYGNYIRA